MKILSNFDTKLDSKIFLKKVSEFWDHNVLLIKRHPLFLYKAFFDAIIAMFLFFGLLGVIYAQYSQNIEYFYIFLVLHLLWIGLWVIILLKKIISKLWNYKEFITCKGDLEKIDLSWFWSFLKYSFILFFYQFVVSIVDIIILFNITSEKTMTISWSIWIFILNILFLFLILKILRRFIDFEMDFIVITKDEIESFDQTWIFRRKVVSLDTKKIRSITTEKDGFFRSLFNIGSLKILSEWDTEQKWEIQFNYIHRLWKLKKTVLNLINK